MTGGAQDSQLTRARTEVKYLVAAAVGAELERQLDEHLARHRHAGHGANRLPLARHFTTTIYFDTPKRELFDGSTAPTHLKLRAREPRLIVEVKHRATVRTWLQAALATVGEPIEGYSKFRVASIAVHGSG